MNQQDRILAVIRHMTSAFARGDVDGVLTTYAPGAVVVGEPGKPVQGEAAIRAMFESYTGSGVSFGYGDHELVVAGDLALHLMKWTMPLPDGLEESALSVAVLQRQPDGQWKMVIDHPFGDGVMARP